MHARASQANEAAHFVRLGLSIEKLADRDSRDLAILLRRETRRELHARDTPAGPGEHVELSGNREWTGDIGRDPDVGFSLLVGNRHEQRREEARGLVLQHLPPTV